MDYLKLQKKKGSLKVKDNLHDKMHKGTIKCSLNQTYILRNFTANSAIIQRENNEEE